VVVGLAHCILDPRDALIGASGTVFCLIMLTAMLAGRSGTIPLTMLLVAALYLGRELAGLFANDGISQTAHPGRGARHNAGPGHAWQLFRPLSRVPPLLRHRLISIQPAGRAVDG